MLQLADVATGDVVYDLGCGDGRLVITAAKRYGARGVGVDIDPARIAESRANAKKEGVEPGGVPPAGPLTVDISPASVVTLYLLTAANLQLRPTLQKQLKPGSRVVSHGSAWETGCRPGPKRSPTGEARRDCSTCGSSGRRDQVRAGPRLPADTLEVAALPLCLVRLMNDRRFPWVILVPTRPNVGRDRRPRAARSRLADRRDRVGVGRDARGVPPGEAERRRLGNIVAQLHVHVVGRFASDDAWPGPVWGTPPERYRIDEIERKLAPLRYAATTGPAHHGRRRPPVSQRCSSACRAPSRARRRARW